MTDSSSVQYYESLFSGTAIITNPSADVSVDFDEGATALLSCTARGLPRPNITWSPGPDSYRTISTYDSMDGEGFEVITSNISITNIQRDDLSYICNASNSLGHGTRSFSLIVNCKYTNKIRDCCYILYFVLI